MIVGSSVSVLGLWEAGPGTPDGFLQADALMLNDSPEPIKAWQSRLHLRLWSSELVMGFHSWGEAGLPWE